MLPPEAKMCELLEDTAVSMHYEGFGHPPLSSKLLRLCLVFTLQKPLYGLDVKGVHNVCGGLGKFRTWVLVGGSWKAVACLRGLPLCSQALPHGRIPVCHEVSCLDHMSLPPWSGAS